MDNDLRLQLLAIADLAVEETLQHIARGEVLINLGLEGRIALIYDKISRWARTKCGDLRDRQEAEHELFNIFSDLLLAITSLHTKRVSSITKRLATREADVAAANDELQIATVEQADETVTELDPDSIGDDEVSIN